VRQRNEVAIKLGIISLSSSLSPLFFRERVVLFAKKSGDLFKIHRSHSLAYNLLIIQ
jgi:hypothetical protein